MKKINTFVNIVILIFTIWMVINYAMIYLQNQKLTETKVTNLLVTNMDGIEVDLLANHQMPAVLFFWATTCPPCMLEMKRFEMAIKSGELPADKILLINLYEQPATIKKYLDKKQLTVPCYIATQSLLNKLNVQVTPTIIHLDQSNTIRHFSSGVGPLTIISAKKFLKQE